MLLGFAKQCYDLEFKERPDYKNLSFELEKAILDLGYIPDNKFDWSLPPGADFNKSDVQDMHSSISSCALTAASMCSMASARSLSRWI